MSYEKGGTTPLLTVAIPTFNRPDLLGQALASVVGQAPGVAGDVEIVVSDNSHDDASKAVYRQCVSAWPGAARYDRNDDAPGMVGNFNRCVARARGRHVLILHDDDYLLPRALDAIVGAIRRHPDRRVLLFGVKVVDPGGKVFRRQEFPVDRYLPPRDALERVLRNSSFVRFPAIVVAREAYEAVGSYDASYGGATDFHMWVRQFGRHGVQTVAATTAAYVVHPQAHTTGVFDRGTIGHTLRTFTEARATGLLDAAALRRCQAAWFHQFILAGAVRRLRAGERREAARVLALFDLPEVKAAGPSLRWLPLRLGLRLATIGGRPTVTTVS